VPFFCDDGLKWNGMHDAPTCLQQVARHIRLFRDAVASITEDQLDAEQLGAWEREPSP
jgi:hypothetical protein